MKNTTRQILEFDVVLSIFESCMKTAAAKRLLGQVDLFHDFDALSREYEISRLMTDFVKFDSNLHFEPVPDAGELLEKSHVAGNVLDTDEILGIKTLLDIYIGNKKTIGERTDKYPELPAIFSPFEVPAGLYTALCRTFEADGTVSDNASHELKSIRKRRVSLRAHIHEKLNAYMTRADSEDIVQERIITVRDGRYVIPVKVGYKNREAFIVHAYSKTGETVFAEPQFAVQANNELTELDELEAAEIFRILQALTASIAENSEILAAIHDAVGVMEFHYAKARFAKEYDCCYPKLAPGTAVIKFKDARHPLLLFKNTEAVPIRIEIGADYQGLVISGPNAGGKTVALKTAGLLTLMALCGLPVPVDPQSQVGAFESVYAEIGDEQSIADELSTFSGHIVRLSDILKSCNDKSLILIDELAGSTEPKEGEALGQAVIKEMLLKGAKFVVTTHYQQLKEMPYSDKRLANAFVEFDEETLTPKFVLHTGAPGLSYALQIAKRFGIDDKVVKDASEYLRERADEYSKLLESINRERNLLFKRKNVVEKQINELREMKDVYDARRTELDTLIENAEKKGVSALKTELDSILYRISEAKIAMKRDKAEGIDAAETVADDAKKLLDDVLRKNVEKERKRPASIEAGMTVYVRTYEKNGLVEDVSEDKVRVRIGIVSVTVERGDLFSVDEPESKPKRGVSVHKEMETSYQYLLDIRGERMEDALKKLDKNVEIALMQGASEMIIIHGTGQGILRKAVWDYFKDKNFISSIQYAKPEDGGQGKSIVKFK